jgi:hypothetical protein
MGISVGQPRHGFSNFTSLAIVAMAAILTAACGAETRTRRTQSLLLSDPTGGTITGGTTGGTSTAGAAFQAARTVLINRCAECHNEYNNMTEAQFVSLNYVTPGNLAGSDVFYRIRGAGVIPSAEDMPKLRPNVPAAEINTIRTWILGLQP